MPREISQEQRNNMNRRLNGEYVPPSAPLTSTKDLIKAIWS